MLTLAASPELFPIDIHPPSDAVALMALSRVDYEKASFLDARLNQTPQLTPSFAEVAAVAARLAVACDFIFHIGHVGSTLLARVLGTHPKVFSLREPQALRTFAQAEPAAPGAPWSAEDWRQRLRVFLALYSRTWLPEQRSLIKATSLVSEVAGPLLELAPDAMAIAMTVRPETYLATILGGPNSRMELTVASAARIIRLNRRLGGGFRQEGLSEGELAAMSWACEMTALDAAAAANPGRIAWIDFDHFLADPESGLATALGALHGNRDPAEATRLAASAYFQRYSKAPEYGYGPGVRAEVLAAARRDAGAEIRSGLAWLERAARRPAIAQALSRAERADVAG